MWPRDVLPTRIPNARVMLFAYNSNVGLDVSESGVRQHANTLLDLLLAERQTEDSAGKPIMMVGHSLGGLVIKQVYWNFLC